jgi:hypothetical protein
MENQRIMFCRIGWMEKYEGLDNGDQITGSGKYVSENDYGSELYNFAKSSDGKIYGYARNTNESIY